MLWVRCLSVTLVYCRKTVEWIKMKLGVEVGLDPGHIVLDEDPAALPQRGTAPPISTHVYCGQTTGCQLLRRSTSAQAALYYMGTQILPKRAQYSPLFSARVYCGQTGAHLSYCWALVFTARAMLALQALY